MGVCVCGYISISSKTTVLLHMSGCRYNFTADFRLLFYS